MAEVFNITDRKKTTKKSTKPSAAPAVGGGYSYMTEVENDITKLCDTLGLDRDEAVDMATDFYRKYPMLMEFVRSPENLLRGK